MSVTIHQAIRDAVNPAFNTTEKRSYAVAAALEVITARAEASDSVSLELEFNNLARYADQIQAALNVR